MPQLVRPVFAVLLAALVLGGCAEDRRVTAEKGVETFHARFNAAQYADIYAAGTDQFRGQSPQALFVKRLTDVRALYGQVKKTQRTKWQPTAGAGKDAVFYTFVQQTEFERGRGEERFVWEVRDGQSYLQGYSLQVAEVAAR